MMLLAYPCILLSQPVTTQSKVNEKSVLEVYNAKCNKGCYLLTHKELIQGLQSARKAALRDSENKKENQCLK